MQLDDGIALFKTSTVSLAKQVEADPTLDEETLEKQQLSHTEQVISSYSLLIHKRSMPSVTKTTSK
jgi:hypothetical protein